MKESALNAGIFCAKTHETKEAVVFACCDKELVGKKLTHNGIEIEISENFYREKEIGLKEVLDLIEKADSINLVGKKIIEEALKAGIIEEEAIMKIGNIPHCQIYKL